MTATPLEVAEEDAITEKRTRFFFYLNLKVREDLIAEPRTRAQGEAGAEPTHAPTRRGAREWRRRRGARGRRAGGAGRPSGRRRREGARRAAVAQWRTEGARPAATRPDPIDDDASAPTADRRWTSRRRNPWR